jgi:hypothetical protein
MLWEISDEKLSTKFEISLPVCFKNRCISSNHCSCYRQHRKPCGSVKLSLLPAILWKTLEHRLHQNTILKAQEQNTSILCQYEWRFLFETNKWKLKRTQLKVKSSSSLFCNRSTASSKLSCPKSAILSFFNFQYFLASFRSSNSCLRLLPRLLVPIIFPSMMWLTRQFLCNMCPIQLAFLHCANKFPFLLFSA